MNWKHAENHRKQTMKAFNQLPSNVISWESFKRLIDKNGTEKGIELAMKIIRKREKQK